MLSVYALQTDAKLSKLLEVLWEMERFDIFLAINQHLEGFHSFLLQQLCLFSLKSL